MRNATQKTARSQTARLLESGNRKRFVLALSVRQNDSNIRVGCVVGDRSFIDNNGILYKKSFKIDPFMITRSSISRAVEAHLYKDVCKKCEDSNISPREFATDLNNTMYYFDWNTDGMCLVMSDRDTQKNVDIINKCMNHYGCREIDKDLGGGDRYDFYIMPISDSISNAADEAEELYKTFIETSEYRGEAGINRHLHWWSNGVAVRHSKD